MPTHKLRGRLVEKRSHERSTKAKRDTREPTWLLDHQPSTRRLLRSPELHAAWQRVSKFRPFQFSRTAAARRKFAAQSHVEKNSTAKGRNHLLSSSSQQCCPDDPLQPRLAAEAKMRRTGLSASWRRYDSDHRRLTHRRLIGVNRRLHSEPRSMSDMGMLQQLSPGESAHFSSKTCWMPGSRGFVLVVKLASWPTPQIPKALRRL